ncbi:hypothetical protein HLH33_03935 [Gluconacetobacter diazotrophicus]|uniref:Uncharacterized protein n=1 Tax=Gluconacetobacter diazotrophicus TaxID=33996 RepID=A0A7W4I5D2_GLUDI|nr:hypothetical protein [Gluconacetobacter diazotrophicus]MBB2155465.1 hypothetical protein [Gluconacetobacter diazotrophicus]
MAGPEGGELLSDVLCQALHGLGGLAVQAQGRGLAVPDRQPVAHQGRRVGRVLGRVGPGHFGGAGARGCVKASCAGKPVMLSSVTRMS